MAATNTAADLRVSARAPLPDADAGTAYGGRSPVLLADLSTGVALEPGHLHVEFSGAEDLLGELFELAQAAANDYDRFCAAAEPVAHRSA